MSHHQTDPVPPVPDGSRLWDTRRMSRPAAQFAWEEYLRQCGLTAMLFEMMTFDADGNIVLYDMLDKDDCAMLGLEAGEGPLELWIVLKPQEGMFA